MSNPAPAESPQSTNNNTVRSARSNWNLQEQQAKKFEQKRRRNEAKAVREAAKKKRQEELAAQCRQQAAQKVEEEVLRRDVKEILETSKRGHQDELAARHQREAIAEEKFIVSGSSVVECGAGLEIRRVIAGFDLCRIMIKNLPREANEEEIADLIRHQGVDRSKFFVMQVKPTKKKSTAVVLAYADEGQAIAVGLENTRSRNKSSNLKVSHDAHWNTMGSWTNNTPFLTVSWWLPSETIVVKYPTLEEAQGHFRWLNSKVWKGRRLRVVVNERRPRPGSALGHHFESITLFGCPPGSGSDQEFYSFVESSEVKVTQSSIYDEQDALRAVQEHLSNCPGVNMDSYEITNNSGLSGGEIKVKIQFDDWDNAKLAHDFLNKKRLGPHQVPTLLSRFSQRHQYTIVIPSPQFDAQKKQWDILSKKKQEGDVHVRTRKLGDGKHVFIQVLGQDKKVAGSLKVKVQSMVTGEKLDRTTHWHPSFSSPEAKIFFSLIYAAVEVYVKNDLKARCLKIYGEPDALIEAREMIKKEVERLAELEMTTELDCATLRFFMREGLGKLKDLLGEENVVLNVATMPAKITIKGGREADHHLQRLIDESRELEFYDGLLPGNDNETCPICTDDVSHPEQLGCGHTYCSACLKHFLTSATEYPLVCVGNENTCKVPVALPFIRRFLPTEVFERHIEAAFASYLEKHPQELKYCTTPDCTQIYRRSNEKMMLQCPSCFSTICPACDEEAHEGITCEERRIHKNPAEQQRLNDGLADANGWKKCPQCTTLIEKTDGCNHMECRCGAHICWACMGTFDAGTIYTHMGEAHGGIYDAVPAGVDLEQAGQAVFHAAQADALARAQREFELAQGAQAQAMILPHHIMWNANANADRRVRGARANNPFAQVDAARVREAIYAQRILLLREQAEYELAIRETERQREEMERQQREEMERQWREEVERARREERRARREERRARREERERCRTEEADRIQREETMETRTPRSEHVLRVEAEVRQRVRDRFWS